MGAAFSETVHCVPAGRCDAKRVRRDIGPAVGDIVDLGCGIVDLAGVDGVDSTQLFGLVEFVVHQVDADDVGTEGVGDVDRREADSAAAVDYDVVTGADWGSVGHCVERGHKPTATAGGGFSVDAVGQRNRVDIGVGDVDLLGERAGSLIHKAEADVVLTDVFAAVATHIAGAAGEVERDCNLLALFDSLDVLASGDDTACGFVTEHMWRVGTVAEPVPITLPAVPVRPTDATADDLGDSTIGFWFGSVDILYGQRLLELFE